METVKVMRVGKVTDYWRCRRGTMVRIGDCTYFSSSLSVVAIGDVLYLSDHGKWLREVA